MALIQVQQQQLGTPSFSIGVGVLGDGLYVLGDAEDGFVGTVTIQAVERTAAVCDFVVKSRSRQAGSTIADGVAAGECPFVPCAYLQVSLGTTATAGATYSTATISDQGFQIEVPATGRVIALDVAYTSGIIDVWVTKVAGASC